MALSLVSVNVNGWEMLTGVWLYFSVCRISLLRWFVWRLMHSLRISFVCGFHGLEMYICCITNETSINSSVEVKGMLIYSQLKTLSVLIHPNLSFHAFISKIFAKCVYLENLCFRGMSFVLLENEHITFFYSMCDIELCVEAMKLRNLKPHSLWIFSWSLYSLPIINF